MKICIGSLNKVKVQAVQAKLASLGNVIVSKDAPSQVSNQPMTDQETVTGAKNRALFARQYGDIGIGLEAGIERLGEQVFLVNWGVLVDEHNQCYYAGGTRLPLPTELAIQLDGTVELADVIDNYAKRQDVRSKEGAIGILTADHCSRQESFESIISLLWGQYIYRKQNRK